MPRLILPRSRKHGLSLVDPEWLGVHKFWEDFSNWTYFIGGVLFVIGSVFFLPQFDEYEPIGSLIYVVASVLYLIISLHDLMEVATHPAMQSLLLVDFVAAETYVLGLILFVLGSIFFLLNVAKYDAGAWTFITGSIMYVLGAINNGLQSYESNTKLNSQYLLISAMSYIVGSTMFLVASVPYLFAFDTTYDEDEVYRFLGAIYISGSLCFLFGGVVNFRRSKLIQTVAVLRIQQDDDAPSKSGEEAAAKSDSVEQAASKSEADEC